MPTCCTCVCVYVIEQDDRDFERVDTTTMTRSRREGRRDSANEKFYTSTRSDGDRRGFLSTAQLVARDRRDLRNPRLFASQFRNFVTKKSPLRREKLDVGGSARAERENSARSGRTCLFLKRASV